MKLIYRVVLRLAILLTIILALWATFFYFTMIDEINDEVDDALEDYSELIITRSLAGEDIAHEPINSNNQYFLSQITKEKAFSMEHIIYNDSMVYIPEKHETEPARVLSTIYRDKHDQYYQLVVMTPNIEKQDLQEAILWWVVVLYATLLLTILILTSWVYHGTTRPLYKLLHWLDEYQLNGKNRELVNPTTITEFKKLNEAAVRNMKRAEEVFEEQRLFIGNASHEMQTPLAVCSNRLEALMEDESFSEQQLLELAKTYETLEYLTKLNKTLLLLSKIDNKQFANRSQVNINTLIKKVNEGYQEVFEYKNIHFSMDEKAELNVLADETIIRILINNLLKNSYVHNINDGEISVTIDTNKLIIKNTSDIGELNSKSIFERFYQGSKKEGSTGLGLALVKSIIEVEKLRISYTYSNNLHCFEILF